MENKSQSVNTVLAPTENQARCAVAVGSAPKTFVAQMMSVAYQRSGDVNDPKNANTDWRAGYAVGRYTDTESLAAIAQEWRDRGEPNGKTNTEFREWKIGFWAGRFTQMDDKRAASSPNTPDHTREKPL